MKTGGKATPGRPASVPRGSGRDSGGSWWFFGAAPSSPRPKGEGGGGGRSDPLWVGH